MRAWIGVMIVLGCGGEAGEVEVGETAAETETETETETGAEAETGAETGAEAETEAETETEAEAETGPETVTGCFRIADGTCVPETFANPPVLAPDGEGVHALTLMPTAFTIDGARHCGRGYNGRYPGPTIDIPARTDAPRQVRVDLRNGFSRSDWHELGGRTCTCEDPASGQSCDPTADHAGHGAHEHGACECHDPDGNLCHFADFNVTNLHAHGSHVRPDYATGGGCVESDGMRCRSCIGDRDALPRRCFFADDVIGKVAPGEGVRHRWDLDEDGTHHEGLDWYHPHIHGTTAIQVAGGATGALIVRGPLDAVPGIAEARERVIVITTPSIGFEPLADGAPCDDDHLTVNDFPTLGATSEKQVNLVNGVRRPRMIVAPGTVERWRFLHGSFLDEIFIAVFRGLDAQCASLDFERGPIALTQIARDGLTLPRPADGEGWPYAPEWLFMSPGYRVEALLDGRALVAGDTLCVMGARFLQADDNGGVVGIQTPPTRDEILQRLTNGDLMMIANVSADAPASGTAMPDLAAVAALAPGFDLKDGTVDALAKCAEAEAITDPFAIDQVALFWAVFFQGEQADDSNGAQARSAAHDNCGCKDHNINCRNFETTDRAQRPYDRVLTLGAVEHWRVTAGFDGHPFHIHINPYVVCPLPPAGSAHRNAKARLFEPPFAHWRDTYLVNLDRRHDFITEYRAFTGEYVQHCHKLTHEDEGMMELLRVCDPATEDCNLCEGRPCEWDVCAPGDTNCEREVFSSVCFLDASRCPEALLRCTTCDDERRCVPGSHCGDAIADDGETRCVPGCVVAEDCLPSEVCEAGSCAPVAPCFPPCGPGTACLHGACR